MTATKTPGTRNSASQARAAEARAAELSDVVDALTGLAGSVLAKTFQSGSKGFYSQSKVSTPAGTYQSQVTATLVGSKSDAKLRPSASIAEVREVLSGSVRMLLGAHTFQSGKTGFYGQSRLMIGGQAYQVAMQAVLIVK